MIASPMVAATSTPKPLPPAAAAASWSPLGWRLALLGQFVLVFALVTLSSPGRIDIVDGQTRYKVARSLVDHGDSAIRDDKTWFGVFPGRNGELHTNYRFPQSVLGVLFLWVADAIGPVNELRRQFFFTLMSSLAAALLALTYSLWFRGLNYSHWASLFWASAGIFCTPSWYYGTSTFDDILGTTTIVAAVAVMWLGRERRPLLAAGVAGLLFAWAFNCKPPLVLFALPALAAGGRGALGSRRQLAQAALLGGGILLGIVAMKGYQDYKFPPYAPNPDSTVEEMYGPIFTPDPVPGLLGLLLSPSSGMFWYCPTLLLAIPGLLVWGQRYRWFALATLAACLTFFGFVSFLVFFKGEPCWGPRYLTPAFALLWVCVPAALERVKIGRVTLVLSLGLLVQLLGLSMDPIRRFLDEPLQLDYYVEQPWLGFSLTTSHLAHRPGEILDVLCAETPRAPKFNPGPIATHVGCYNFEPRIWSLTAATTLGNLATPLGPAALLTAAPAPGTHLLQDMAVMQLFRKQYHIFNAFRPWWAAHGYLPAAERPVDLERTLWLLLGLGASGLGLVVLGSWLPRGNKDERKLFLWSNSQDQKAQTTRDQAEHESSRPKQCHGAVWWR